METERPALSGPGKLKERGGYTGADESTPTQAPKGTRMEFGVNPDLGVGAGIRGKRPAPNTGWPRGSAALPTATAHAS